MFDYPIRHKRMPSAGRFVPWLLLALGILLMLLAAAGTAGAAPAPVAAKEKLFATPEAAVQDLVTAVKEGDRQTVMAIFGPQARSVIFSGDAVADHEAGERFVQSYEEAHSLEKAGDAKVVLNTGKDAWPFPVPIVRDGGGWRFDTAAGKEEILNRRIGRNETYVVQAALAYVDAQLEYFVLNPQKGKLLIYAKKFVSAPGKRDGLYYPTAAGESASPLGPLFDSARAKGYLPPEDGRPAAYQGYRYRILTAQGPDAAAGAYDYVVKDGMMGGFALVAWPAAYNNSGVMTFMVNHDGVVYEKDLGPNTDAAVKKITRFNPDKSWSKTAEPARK
jgi:hypothetical protein